MKKYDPLMLYLDKCDKSQITLSYREIEEILGDSLPATAHKKAEWWSNNDTTHTQSSAWSDVDYKTTNIKLGESVTFIKETR